MVVNGAETIAIHYSAGSAAGACSLTVGMVCGTEATIEYAPGPIVPTGVAGETECNYSTW
jgi:hypothetical protein